MQLHICSSNLTAYLVKLSAILFFESIHAMSKSPIFCDHDEKKKKESEMQTELSSTKYSTGSVKDLNLSEAEIRGQFKL